MKKSLLTLAVLSGFAAASMAADVQVYGLIDTGLTYYHTDADKAGVDSTDELKMTTGQEFGPRFGLRGTEDLGNGYKVGFVLENGFNSDDGQLTQSGKIFGRESNVYVTGPFGEVRFGLMPVFGSTLGANGLFRAIDVLYANTTSAFGSGHASASKWTRVNNAISYKTPTFAGLTGYAMYSMKNDSDNGAENKTTSERYASLAARYQNGAFEAIVVGDMTMYAGNDKNNGDDGMTWTVGGNYTFDNQLKVIAFVQWFKDQQLSRAGIIADGLTQHLGAATYGYVDGLGYSLGVNYPIGGGVAKAQVAYRDMENQNDVDFKRLTLCAGYDYAFTKRTSVYLMGGWTQEKIESATIDAKPSGYELTTGILHRF